MTTGYGTGHGAAAYLGHGRCRCFTNFAHRTLSSVASVSGLTVTLTLRRMMASPRPPGAAVCVSDGVIVSQWPALSIPGS